jgi:hypothetical protein
MDKAQAIKLWDSIDALIDAKVELAGEGNSGEFHNDEEEEKLVAEADNAFEALIETFYQATGFYPFWDDDFRPSRNPHINGEGSWVLLDKKPVAKWEIR